MKAVVGSSYTGLWHWLISELSKEWWSSGKQAVVRECNNKKKWKKPMHNGHSKAMYAPKIGPYLVTGLSDYIQP